MFLISSTTNVTGMDPDNPGRVVQILDEIAKRANFYMAQFVWGLQRGVKTRERIDPGRN